MQAKNVTLKVIIPLKAFPPFWALEGLIVFRYFLWTPHWKGQSFTFKLKKKKWLLLAATEM